MTHRRLYRHMCLFLTFIDSNAYYASIRNSQELNLIAVDQKVRTAQRTRIHTDPNAIRAPQQWVPLRRGVTPYFGVFACGGVFANDFDLRANGKLLHS